MSIRTSFLYRKLTKQIILLDYNVDLKSQRAYETLKFAKMSKAQAFSLGYVKGKKMKDELKYAFFPIYVRFSPPMAPAIPFFVDEETQAKIENRETSSTLYDHWKSNAIEKFLKGMTTRTALPSIDQKKLLMIAAIIIGAVAGLYLIIF